MCGIASIFAWHPSAPPVDPTELASINQRLRSRGPDDCGIWISPDGRVGLANRRLAIVDLSAAGHQPMVASGGRFTISFNGEIYNHRELRRELQDDGAGFQSQTDTEVVLRLFARDGIAMVDRLRGMFAFAIWDSELRELFLARDPYGIKPLYYADDGRSLRAASQVKALRESGRVSAAIDPAGAAGFFLLGSVPEPFTTYEEIRSVPAGSWIRVTGSGLSQAHHYFSVSEVFRQAIDSSGPPQGDAQEHDRIVEALRESVRCHLVSDVPVGAFLSAGIDSSAVVGLARDAGAEDLATLTLAFDEFRGSPDDESPPARTLAAYYGTRHSEVVLTRRELEAELPSFFRAMDQPTIDGLNTWFVSRAAASLGWKVALSGLGGDELFGGYPSFHDIPRLVRLMRIPSRIPFAGDLFRRGYALFVPERRRLRPKTAGLVAFGGTWPGAYLLRRGVYLPWELESVLGTDLAEEGLRRLDVDGLVSAAMDPDPGRDRSRVATLEACLYMRNQLLRDTDWASMAHSLEVRVPLVDAQLLREIAPILVRDGFSRGKEPLAASPSRPLPEVVRRRPKTGFRVPLAEWLNETTQGLGSRAWARQVWESFA